MYVYVSTYSICMYMYVYVCMYILAQVNLSICMYMHLYACIILYACICSYNSDYVRICMYMRICTYIFSTGLYTLNPLNPVKTGWANLSHNGIMAVVITFHSGDWCSRPVYAKGVLHNFEYLFASKFQERTSSDVL